MEAIWIETRDSQGKSSLIFSNKARRNTIKKINRKWRQEKTERREMFIEEEDHLLNSSGRHLLTTLWAWTTGSSQMGIDHKTQRPLIVTSLKFLQWVIEMETKSCHGKSSNNFIKWHQMTTTIIMTSKEIKVAMILVHIWMI